MWGVVDGGACGSFRGRGGVGCGLSMSVSVSACLRFLTGALRRNRQALFIVFVSDGDEMRNGLFELMETQAVGLRLGGVGFR